MSRSAGFCACGWRRECLGDYLRIVVTSMYVPCTLYSGVRTLHIVHNSTRITWHSEFASRTTPHANRAKQGPPMGQRQRAGLAKAELLIETQGPRLCTLRLLERYRPWPPGGP